MGRKINLDCDENVSLYRLAREWAQFNNNTEIQEVIWQFLLGICLTDIFRKLTLILYILTNLRTTRNILLVTVFIKQVIVSLMS